MIGDGASMVGVVREGPWSIGVVIGKAEFSLWVWPLVEWVGLLIVGVVRTGPHLMATQMVDMVIGEPGCRFVVR